MELDRVARFVSLTKGRGLSIGTLARRLGVTFPTAKRHLEQYAKANGLCLEGQYARVGRTGPLSVVWRLVPARPGPFAVVKETRPTKQPPAKPAPPAPPPPAPEPVTFPLRPLPAAPETLAKLSPDQQRALELLLKRDFLRTSEIARALRVSPARVEGMMRQMIRVLHAGGKPLYDDEPLPNGETLYRLLPGTLRLA